MKIIKHSNKKNTLSNSLIIGEFNTMCVFSDDEMLNPSQSKLLNLRGYSFDLFLFPSKLKNIYTSTSIWEYILPHLKDGAKISFY